jgi:beta-glucosidase
MEVRNVKTSSSTRTWRGVICALVSLLVVVFGLSRIAEDWKTTLDSRLGTVSSKVVTTESENIEDLYPYTSDYASTTDLVNAHRDLAERLQEEGSVLLKNNNALPLENGARVTLLGMRSFVPVYGGQIGSDPTPSQNVSLIDALKEKGFGVNPIMERVYFQLGRVAGQNVDHEYVPGRLRTIFSVSNDNTTSLRIGEPPLSAYTAVDDDYMESFSEYSDAAIVVIGRPSSEGADYFPGEPGMAEGEGATSILGLTANEREIIAHAKDNFDVVVVLINSGNPMEIEELKRDDQIDSVLWVGQPGNYGFLGVADLLNGTVSPSGRLTDTYAVNSASSPAMQNYGVIPFANQEAVNTEELTYTDYRAGWYLVCAEGIYTGYKYYETRYADAVNGNGSATSAAGSSTGRAWNYSDEVSYSFGYGLSYTAFEQSLGDVSFNDEEHAATVSVSVENTGSVPGMSVVQLYAQSPYTEYDIQNGVEKSSVQLMGFEKTKELQPGESEDVLITVDLQYLASYDDTNAKTYIMDDGDYFFAIGDGAHDALNNILAAHGKTTSDGMDYDGDATRAYTWRQDRFDGETYSVSRTGVEVTNQLDDADLNYYLPDSVVYLSRSDWEGTWPDRYSGIEASEDMIFQLRNDIYTIKTGEDTTDIFPEVDNGMTLTAMHGAEYDDERWDDLLDQLSLEEICYVIRSASEKIYEIPSIGSFPVWEADGPGGFIRFKLADRSTDENSPTYVPKEDTNANYSLVDMPMEIVVGATFSKDLAHEQGVLFGNDSLWVDTVFIWAPGLNLHRSPYNARNYEYYSEDAMLSNHLGNAVVQGAYGKGLIMSPKHFAFNDQETNRYGLSVFMDEQKAREGELRVFQGVFEGGGLGTMTAYNRIGATFVNGHEGLMRGILRDEWGFTGYNVSDFVNGDHYMTVKESVVYGAVSVMDTMGDERIQPGNAWDYFTAAGLRGDATICSAIRDNTQYLLYTIANSNAMNGLTSSSYAVSVMTWWRATFIGMESLLAVLLLLALWRYALAIRSSGGEEAKS